MTDRRFIALEQQKQSILLLACKRTIKCLLTPCESAAAEHTGNIINTTSFDQTLKHTIRIPTKCVLTTRFSSCPRESFDKVSARSRDIKVVVVAAAVVVGVVVLASSDSRTYRFSSLRSNRASRSVALRKRDCCHLNNAFEITANLISSSSSSKL